MRHIIWLSLLLSMGCNTNPKEKTKQSTNPNDSTVDSSGKKKNGLIKSYKSDGKLYSAITYKDGVKDGVSYAYYPNGKVSLELTYSNGKRVGQSKRYYEDGNLYTTTEYKDNNLYGWQKKYRIDGTPISESKFENGEPCLGLKEYLTNKTLKKNFPNIIITPIDELATKGKYTLKLSMSDKTKKVKFYQGNLSPGGCIHDELDYVLLDERTGTGEIVYHLPPGGFLMQELNIVASVRTLQGNTYITQKAYNLAIDN